MNRSAKLILLACSLLLIWAYFVPPQTIQLRGEEPRRAIVSLEMLYNGDYITPYINGWKYYNKPPGFNWIMVGAYKLFGSASEWVVRFPSLFAFLLTGLATFLISRRFTDQTTAVLSGLGVFTSAEILAYGSTQGGEIDLFFSLIVFLQMITLFLGFRKSRWSWHIIISFLLMAFGTLTKGLPAIAFQGLTIIGWTIAQRNWKMLFRIDLWVGAALFIILILGYFIRYDQLNGDGWIYAVNLYKEAAQKSGMESQTMRLLKGIITNPGQFAVLFAPWTLLLIPAFNRTSRKLIRQNDWIWFCAVFIIANIGLYWFTGSLPLRYVYMFVPFGVTIAIYLGVKQDNWSVKILFRLSQSILVIIGLAGLIAPLWSEIRELPHWTVFSVAAVLLGFGGFYLSLRAKNINPLVWTIAAMAVFKVTSSFIYYDSLVVHSPDSQHYKKDMLRLVEQADGNRIYLYAPKPYQFKRDASIGSYKMEEVTLETAMLLAYQIPYYITREQGQVMQFETSLTSGRYYVARKSDVNKLPIEIVDEFFDDWTDLEMVLFRAL